MLTLDYKSAELRKLSGDEARGGIVGLVNKQLHSNPSAILTSSRPSSNHRFLTTHSLSQENVTTTKTGSKQLQLKYTFVVVYRSQ